MRELVLAQKMDDPSPEEIEKERLRKLGIEYEVRIIDGRSSHASSKSKNTNQGSRKDTEERQSRSSKGESKEDRKGSNGGDKLDHHKEDEKGEAGAKLRSWVGYGKRFLRNLWGDFPSSTLGKRDDAARRILLGRGGILRKSQTPSRPCRHVQSASLLRTLDTVLGRKGGSLRKMIDLSADVAVGTKNAP